MKTIYLNKVGEGGLISNNDFPSFEIGPDSINDGSNFRFKNSFITRSDGWKKIPLILGTAFAGYRFHSGTVLNSGDHQGMIFILYKLPPPNPLADKPARRQWPGQPSTRIIADVKLARWNGKTTSTAELTLIDVSPTQGLALTFIDQPQLFSYLGAVYCNMQDGAPLVYRPWDTVTNRFVRMDIDYTETPMPPVPYEYFPSTWRIKVLVPFNNHLVGVGYSEGSTDKNYQVIWSDIFEDADFLPDWNPKPENEAGSTILPDVFGDSFSAVALGDNLMIYTLTTTFRLYPVGLPLVFGLEKVFPNIGCVGTNCVQEFENYHFVATLNNAYVHNGSTLKSVAEGRVSKLISSLSTNFDSIGVFHNFVYKEMYLYFSNRTDLTYANEMLVYNYQTDQWSRQDCPYVSNIMTAYGLNPTLTWDMMTDRTYGQINVDFEALKRTTANWTFYYVSQFDESSIEMTTPDIYLRTITADDIIKDPTLAGKDGKTYITRFQRDLLDLWALDSGQKDQGLQKYLYEMLVYLKGTKDITVTNSIQMGSSGKVKEMSQNIKNFETANFDELKEWKIDLRATGRYISYEIEKSDEGKLEIKSIQFKYKPRGLR